jgi:hypothetical protein
MIGSATCFVTEGAFGKSQTFKRYAQGALLLVQRDLSEDFLQKHHEVRRRVTTHRRRLSKLGKLLSTRTSPLGRRQARTIVEDAVIPV